MRFSNNKEQTELDKIKGGCCSLKHNFLIRHFSFSLENKDKTPGVETNPPLHNYMYPYNFNFSMDHANEKGVSLS